MVSIEDRNNFVGYRHALVAIKEINNFLKKSGAQNNVLEDTSLYHELSGGVRITISSDEQMATLYIPSSESGQGRRLEVIAKQGESRIMITNFGHEQESEFHAGRSAYRYVRRTVYEAGRRAGVN